MTSENWHNRLLIAEVIICFAPITISLIYGLFVLPAQIIQMVDHGQNTMPFIAITVGGVFGFFGVLMLLMKHLLGDRSSPSPLTIIVCLLVGFVAFSFYAVFVLSISPSVWEFLMFGAPLLMGLHLLYVARRHIIPATKKDKGA